ncbi:carbon monoxide dehydrogenase subunit G [Spongiactinospora sp. TRM90649]|uniref:SRPBCC family protein n=1 Tax=Spongiactinospora sp. TRM90649 TaxID=3031114 RepID=UPI0023F74399|nr:carbon monoxide dehydrogenase subunit G [Spongiactinospora sp. TRM90649]MDF5752406.1 carbon monoxide dehydrogenase subunit G [Spongiactinospora sp. TRM90649]
MKVVGSAVIGVERPRLWTAMRDPGVLVRTIPGCKRLEEVGGDAYRMTVAAGVASIKGVYQGEVTLSDLAEPEGFTLKASGQGAPGTVDATVRVRLSDDDTGGTRVEYDAEAVIGGMIGGVGQRMLASVAKRTAAQFFTAIERTLSVPAEVPALVTAAGAADAPAVTESVPASAVAGAPETAAAGPRVFTRPAESFRPGLPDKALIAAFGTGAGIALGSAVVGWLLGRTAKRR